MIETAKVRSTGGFQKFVEDKPIWWRNLPPLDCKRINLSSKTRLGGP